MPGHVRSLGKRKDGSTIWQGRWRPADDASDRKREERSFKTKREAERWISSRDSDVIRGAYAPAAKGATLLPALADELRSVWTAKGLEPKTRAGYEAILRWWLIGPSDPLHPDRPCRFQKVKVGAVTTKMVQEFVEEVAANRAPNTTRRILGVLNALMKLAARRGYIAANPCEAVEFPTQRRAGIRRSHLYLEGPELLKLADAVPAHWRLPVLVAGSCGLRAGELWALRRRDIDILHGELTVRYALKEINSSALEHDKGLIVGPPKSAASRRRLSMATELVSLLTVALAETPARDARSANGFPIIRTLDEQHAELAWTTDANDPDRLVFVTPRGYPVRHNNFYKKVFRPAVVGDPDHKDPKQRRPPAVPSQKTAVRWHDLRHTCAALSLAAPGGNLAMVKERLGHEQISTTADLYGKRVPSVDASIADAVGSAIFNASAPTNVTALRDGRQSRA